MGKVSNSLAAALQDSKTRSWIFQIIVLAAVVLLFVTIAQNTAQNLQKQGIAAGFDFLRSTAGFDIIQTLIPYNESSSYGQAFLVAVLNTILVSALGIGLATILGFAIGIARLSPNWLVSRLATTYIEVIRNIPLLLQLFFWYFAVLRALPSPRQSIRLGEIIFLNIRGLYVPKPLAEPGFAAFVSIGCLCVALFIGARIVAKRFRVQHGHFPGWTKIVYPLLIAPIVIALLAAGSAVSWEYPVLKGFNFEGGVTLIPELVALLVALTTYTASFIAEIVRAGILAVDKGQREAASSLGLTAWQSLRFVIVPQAMRVITPPVTSQYLNLTKNSSLAAAIAYPDLVLVFAGTVLMQTGQAVEVILMTMIVYLTLSLLISLFMNIYNRKTALVGR